jgi:hypothetical protein
MSQRNAARSIPSDYAILAPMLVSMSTEDTELIRSPATKNQSSEGGINVIHTIIYIFQNANKILVYEIIYFNNEILFSIPS